MDDFVPWCRHFVKTKGAGLLSRAGLRQSGPVIGFVSHRIGSDYKFGHVIWLARDKRSGRSRIIGSSRDLRNPLTRLQPQERLIAKHNTPDNIALKAATAWLQSKVDHRFCAQSYAFRRKSLSGEDKNHIAALRQFQSSLSSQPFVLRVDVKDFYGSICHARLQGRLSGMIDSPSAQSFLRHYLLHVEQITGASKGVLQGSPISGVLGNVYLHPVDKVLRKKRYQFLRYSDDIVLMRDSERKIDNAFGVLQSELQRMGLCLSVGPEKMEQAIFNANAFQKADSQRWSDSISFLGFRFFQDGGFSIREASLARAKAYVHRVTTDGPGAHDTPKAVIDAINFYLGFGYRRKKTYGQQRSMRIFHPRGRKHRKRNWVRFFTALGPSDRITAQLQELDRFSRQQLLGWCAQRKMPPREASKHIRKLGFSVGLFRTLTEKRQD